MGPRDGGAKREFDQARAEKAVTELLIAMVKIQIVKGYVILQVELLAP